MSQRLNSIQQRYKITGILKLESGLHIGSSGDYSPIGAVDSVIIRDELTQEPMIPGSSLKGKIRSLLAAEMTDSALLPDLADEPIKLRRLFGTGGNEILRSRLQFYDLFLASESKNHLENSDTDLYMTEIKFENTINRATAVANPRQIERVPRGAEFNFNLNYLADSIDEITDDFKTLGKGIFLLQLDYLGGGGSRGNGRVSFHDLDVIKETGNNSQSEQDCADLKEILHASYKR